MIANWEIWIGEPNGVRLQALKPISFTVIKALNRVGSFSMNLAGDFNMNPIKLDGLVEFWRGTPEIAPRWVNIGMVRNIEYWQDAQGRDYITVSGPDVIDILARRIITGAAGSATASKTDHADDMIKAIVREQLGASAAAARTLSTYISVAVDTAQGYSLSKAFAYRNVLQVLQEIALVSRENSYPIYFDLAPYVDNNGIKFIFETYYPQPGTDRTGTNTMVFGSKHFNMTMPRFEYDYTEEVTVAYAGGRGEGADRYVAEVSDDTRAGESIYNRREGFTDARNQLSTTGVDDQGAQAVRAGRPVARFSGVLQNGPHTQYGRDWLWGDKVVVEYREIQTTALIETVLFSVGSDGQEIIEARFNVEDPASYGGRLRINRRGGVDP